MPKFFYIARDKLGKKNTGAEEAATQEEAILRLQSRDLVVVSILPEFKESGISYEVISKEKFKPKHYRITGDDLVLFCRQLATLLSAGVTILKSLDIISQQVSSRRLFEVIQALQKKMEAGLSFHESMSKYRDIFSELWVNLVESGEASGNLAMVLSRLATYLERNAGFKKKIVSALIYPTILMLVGTGALMFLTLKIIPTFSSLFKGFNVEMPFLTRLLIAFSDFLRKYLLFIIGGGIGGFFFVKKYVSTKQGRKSLERFLFNLPVFGEFFRVLTVERFTSEMATLVESGVPILYSLEITEHSVGNLVLGEIISQIKEDVREGKPLSQPLDRSGFFDPMAVQMVTIGEEIGELSSMFKKLNSFYQEYVDTFMTRFTVMFEPVMLIFMGVAVGLMVVGMFLPIFQLVQIR